MSAVAEKPAALTAKPLRLPDLALILTFAVAVTVLLIYALGAPQASHPALEDAAWDRSFDSVELDPNGEPFRWMRARGAIPLPRLSTAPHLITLELQNVRPDGRTVAAQISQGTELNFVVASGRRLYRLVLPGSFRPTADALAIGAETFQPSGDRRLLSLVIRGATSAPIGPGLPWWTLTAAAALALVGLLTVLLRSFTSPRWALPAVALVPPVLIWLGPAPYGPSAALLMLGALVAGGATIAIRRLGAGLVYPEIETRPWARADYLLAAGFAAGAVMLRVALLPRQVPILNGDDYLTGSFAANIVLRGWHALYYGHHTGTLASYLVAPAMFFGGVNTLSVLALPIALTAVLTWALYGLGNDLAGRWGGTTAALWMLAPSATALWWTMKPQPGYLEALTFAALALWGTVRVLYGERSRRELTLLMAGVALSAALAFWAGMVIASVLLVCGMLALIRWRRLPQLPLAGYGLALVVALLFVIPTAIYIVQRPGDNPLWWVIGRDTEGLPLDQAFLGLIRQVTPLALGVIRPWPMEPVEPWLAVAIELLSLAGLLVAVWLALGTARAALIPVGLTAAVTALFCFSSFNTLLSDVRYVLPIYLALPLFAALLVATVRGAFGQWLAGSLLAAFLATNWLSGVGGFLSMAPSFERGEAAAAEILLAEGVTHVHSSYWIAQPLMVESGGRILASGYLGPSRVDYDERVRDAAIAATPNVALIVRTDGEFQRALDGYLAARAIECRRQPVADLTLYLGCTPFPDMVDLRKELPMALFE